MMFWIGVCVGMLGSIGLLIGIAWLLNIHERMVRTKIDTERNSQAVLAEQPSSKPLFNWSSTTRNPDELNELREDNIPRGESNRRASLGAQTPEAAPQTSSEHLRDLTPEAKERAHTRERAIKAVYAMWRRSGITCESDCEAAVDVVLGVLAAQPPSKELRDFEEREAAICPEDYGFEEVIKTLRGEIAALTTERDGLRSWCDPDERETVLQDRDRLRAALDRVRSLCDLSESNYGSVIPREKLRAALEGPHGDAPK